MKRFLPLLVSIGIILLFTACPSTPATQSPSPAASATASAAALPDPAAERDKATALRSTAQKYGLNELLPSDWAQANNSFVAGGDAYGKDNALAKSSYESAISLFTALIEKGIPLAIANAKARMEEYRKADIDAKANAAYPDHFAVAEEAKAAAETMEKGGKLEATFDAYARARDLYLIVYKKSQCDGLRARIQEKNYATLDSANFDLAETKYKQIDEFFDKENQKALDTADEAILRYNLVINKGQELIVLAKRNNTDKAKQTAIENKADILASDLFSAALKTYDDAAALLAVGKYDEAGVAFDNAAEAFGFANEAAKVKLAAAAEAAQARSTTDASRAAALEYKANVADKDNYAKANDLYNQAVKAEADGNFAKAKELYASAKDLFDLAYANAKAKKEKAEAEVKKAKDAKDQSLKKAQDGDAKVNAPANL